jgi:hypothetical protein
MTSQNKLVWVLSTTAAFLLAACLFVQKPVSAEISVTDGTYSLTTYPGNTGNDILYVTNVRRGLIGVFVWDNASRSLEPRALQPLSAAFGNAE